RFLSFRDVSLRGTSLKRRGRPPGYGWLHAHPGYGGRVGLRSAPRLGVDPGDRVAEDGVAGRCRLRAQEDARVRVDGEGARQTVVRGPCAERERAERADAAPDGGAGA